MSFSCWFNKLIFPPEISDFAIITRMYAVYVPMVLDVWTVGWGWWCEWWGPTHVYQCAIPAWPAPTQSPFNWQRVNISVMMPILIILNTWLLCFHFKMKWIGWQLVNKFLLWRDNASVSNFVKFIWRRRGDVTYKYSLSDGNLDNSYLHVEKTQDCDKRCEIYHCFGLWVVQFQTRRSVSCLGRLCSTRSWFIFGNCSNYKA